MRVREFLPGADVFDLAEMAGAGTLHEWIVAREQLAQSSMVRRFLRDGRLLGLMGIYPVSRELGECWFDIKREAAPDMLWVARQVRLTLTGTPYPALVTVVRTPAGAKIARACGFGFFQTTSLGDVYGQGIERNFRFGRAEG